MIVVKLDSSYEALSECYENGAEWVTGFSLDKIEAALNELSY